MDLAHGRNEPIEQAPSRLEDEDDLVRALDRSLPPVQRLRREQVRARGELPLKDRTRDPSRGRSIRRGHVRHPDAPIPFRGHRRHPNSF